MESLHPAVDFIRSGDGYSPIAMILKWEENTIVIHYSRVVVGQRRRRRRRRRRCRRR